MEALEILRREHRQIERVLLVLTLAVNEARRGGRFPLEAFEAVARFVRRHADGLHHAKEEDVLLPAMVEAGMSLDRGELASVRAEHDATRVQLEAMLRFIAEVRAGNEDAKPWLLDAAHAYAELQMGHIDREDRYVFPLAKKRVPPLVLARMPGWFAELDRALPSTFAEAAAEVEASGQPERSAPRAVEGSAPQR